MDLGELIPIVAIISTAIVMLSAIRFWRERLRVEDGLETAKGGTQRTVPVAEENARLAHENEALRLTVRRLEERMTVLERIATDPAERTAREIEQLR
jgi:hypothetical protein